MHQEQSLYHAYFEFKPHFYLALGLHENRLSSLDQYAEIPLCVDKPSVFAQSIIDELQQYRDNPKHRFSVKLATGGSVFQRKVWTALQAIPAGYTVTYGELAKQLDTGARAVANACRANPISIIIPCHRVVSASGIGGYMGKTQGQAIAYKRLLLEHEQMG